MTETTLTTLVLIAAISLASPFIAELSGKLGVPDIVILLVAGILIGPDVLGIAHVDDVVSALSDMGLTVLIFLAGFEMDLARIKGRPLKLAASGWVMSVAIAMAIGFALVRAGLAVDTVVVGLALTATALGTLLPVLQDSGLSEGEFGTRILAIGAAGEFGPILAVAIALDQRDPLDTAALLILFVAVALGAAFMAVRANPPKLVALMRRHLQSSAQLPVRTSVLLIIALVYLATLLGLDVLLGAFAAGIVIRLFVADPDREVVKGKLEAIGFGFLIPVFFVVSGIRFNLHELLTSSNAAVRVPFFLLLFLVVRGIPTFLLNRDLPRYQLLPLVLFSATTLPLVVVITTIGLAEHRMLPENAAALEGAAMLSVVLYPLAAKLLLRRGQASELKALAPD